MRHSEMTTEEGTDGLVVWRRPKDLPAGEPKEWAEAQSFRRFANEDTATPPNAQVFFINDDDLFSGTWGDDQHPTAFASWLAAIGAPWWATETIIMWLAEDARSR